jgi:hypothetical protein
MEDYHITMDQFKEHFMDLNDNEKMKNKYKNLDTKFKTLFTKSYNKKHQSIFKRTKKKGIKC